MKIETAEKLREEWGGKPCDHSYIDKERYLGTHTGEYVCKQCGKLFDSKDQWKELTNER